MRCIAFFARSRGIGSTDAIEDGVWGTADSLTYAKIMLEVLVAFRASFAEACTARHFSTHGETSRQAAGIILRRSFFRLGSIPYFCRHF
jgi:hypothetical protein